MSPINDIPKRQMTHPEKQEQAKGLFVRGYKPPEVAQELSMNIRTVQRWFKLWKIEQGLIEPTINVKPKPKPTAIVKVDPPEVVEQTQPATTEPKLLGFDGTYQEWNVAITNKFKELGEVHRKERLKCQSLRDQRIADGITSRDVNSFSQAITRHAEQEFRMLLMGKTDLPTATQSYAWMKQAGFTIIKAGIEDDTISQSDTTSEITGESGEGHATTEG